ncbi:Lar family restriction alleviation protein [Pseudomonas sp. LF135]
MPEINNDDQAHAAFEGLLPCPLCAADAKISRPYGSVCVICTGCHLVISDHDGKSAIAKWNTRTRGDVSDNWKLVPTLPTLKVLKVAEDLGHPDGYEFYKGMLAALP